MATLEREFYRNARGAKPTDQDAWTLVFDDLLKRLFVRHEWQAGGQSGVREYGLEEFLAQHGVAADALIALMFERGRRRRWAATRETEA
jgi:hypothetical protein